MKTYQKINGRTWTRVFDVNGGSSTTKAKGGVEVTVYGVTTFSHGMFSEREFGDVSFEEFIDSFVPKVPRQRADQLLSEIGALPLVDHEVIGFFDPEYPAQLMHFSEALAVSMRGLPGIRETAQIVFDDDSAIFRVMRDDFQNYFEEFISVYKHVAKNKAFL